MRHDPASGAIIIMLRSLKMHGMAVVPKARLWRDPSQISWSKAHRHSMPRCRCLPSC